MIPPPEGESKTIFIGNVGSNINIDDVAKFLEVDEAPNKTVCALSLLSTEGGQIVNSVKVVARPL